MKNAFSTMLFLLLLGTAAEAQQDLYKWQLSGYTGVSAYINEANSFAAYYEPDHNLFHQAELSFNLAKGFSVAAGYGYGQILGRNSQQRSFRTNAHLTALRAYYYTDNGYFLHASSRVAPYFFIGYGLGAYSANGGAKHVDATYVPALPFGVGVKLRIAERWQVALQSELVYLQDRHLPTTLPKQNSRNSAYVHTGIKLGYSFGFRKSTFRASSLYANDVTARQGVAAQDQPRQNMLEAMLHLEPRRIQLPIRTDSTYLLQQQLQRAAVSPPATLVSPAEERIVNSPDTTSSQAEVLQTTAREQTMAKRQQDSLAAITQQAGRTNLSRASDTTTAASIRQVAPVARQQARSQQAAVAPEQPVRTEQIVTEGPERVVYRPADNQRAAVPVVANVGAGRSPDYSQQVRDLQENNRQLKLRLDSLQATQQSQLAKVLGASTVADTGLVQFLQQQVAFNQNLLLRLNEYEQEVALMQKVPVATADKNLVAPSAEAATTVFYPINTYQVPAASLPDLNLILNLLQQHPAAEVKLSGYSSQSGKPAYNLALSRKRVQALVDFLVGQGVQEERISTQYLGNAKAADNENPLDRKVEIRLN
ncbi:OmpA family protein [Pontibacter qinzhouensis]|uniref:OmpA family protein n=1 Tax=Pontibacter qinzhouensis TaxID=2603253 RepID=A0A5C8IQU7_9BACT|nr:OmpA family protein [Pontibacter qinzhouensis]TXK23600.1 OmpA family protein [Pontibacter qinzhouensis]